MSNAQDLRNYAIQYYKGQDPETQKQFEYFYDYTLAIFKSIIEEEKNQPKEIRVKLYYGSHSYLQLETSPRLPVDFEEKTKFSNGQYITKRKIKKNTINIRALIKLVETFQAEEGFSANYTAKTIEADDYYDLPKDGHFFTITMIFPSDNSSEQLFIR